VDGHEQSFYAVYDGHGGDRASAMAAKRLHSLLWEQGRACWQDPRRALEQAFRTLDQDWLKLANKNQWDDGSTAGTLAFLRPLGLVLCAHRAFHFPLCRAASFVSCKRRKNLCGKYR